MLLDAGFKGAFLLNIDIHMEKMIAGKYKDLKREGNFKNICFVYKYQNIAKSFGIANSIGESVCS